MKTKLGPLVGVGRGGVARVSKVTASRSISPGHEMGSAVFLTCWRRRTAGRSKSRTRRTPRRRRRARWWKESRSAKDTRARSGEWPILLWYGPGGRVEHVLERAGLARCAGLDALVVLGDRVAHGAPPLVLDEGVGQARGDGLAGDEGAGGADDCEDDGGGLSRGNRMVNSWFCVRKGSQARSGRSCDAPSSWE